ncbi:AAA family ATPase [Mycolicibacterium rufum]|uniref:AAA family ATPase n=1 Tax=Mycolicibacterium rufum TaxID=318424 RepID=A0ABY3UN58_9MYCO|nr:LuxR family transcriptional regulator [Mycolicibacterium rufum]KGI67532.1 LuxR family transcriptional regulator [Mycolicibacterium rufum]ULP38493.1 AAA family ATPase [Mycolicibacterium rufum]
MTLTGRERELDQLAAKAAAAHAGRGGAVVVCGESGAGKTTFVEEFVRGLPDGTRVLWGACDPLSTPRPLGPLRDLAHGLSAATRRQLVESTQPYDIFVSVFEELRSVPSVLVLDDLQWADQGTLDLCRFLLRRAAQSSLLTIGILRDDEVSVTHPLRGLLGDVARSPHAHSLTVPPLSVGTVAALAADRDVDAVWLHRITGGNAFFVCEMLDHDCSDGADLPTTVRDAILARTADLDATAWDLLQLLTCAPGAIGDRLLIGLGVTLPALRALDQAKLIRRDARGVAFRHDLCRRAIASVIPPGAEPGLHRRFIDVLDADRDPAVLTHHALGAGDTTLVATAAAEAGRAAARAGAHTQACEFFQIALRHGGLPADATEAELLELLAAEYYLTDRLADAINACRRAMLLRRAMGSALGVSANHHALAVYEWYSGNRVAADGHAADAVAALDDAAMQENSAHRVQLGHALAMQAYLAVQASHVDDAHRTLLRARDIVAATGDADLSVRVELIGHYCAILRGDDDARLRLLAVLASAPRHIDETYSSGYTNLTYFDVEQRRLGPAGDLLGESIPLMVEHDLPICRMVQLGSRSRWGLLTGDWDAALADADAVLDAPSAPLARVWPLLIRGLVTLRRTGADTGDIDEAWELASRFGEMIRVLPAACALAERTWLTGVPEPRLQRCDALLDAAPITGLEWARGELLTWCRRLGAHPPDRDVAGVAEPYALLLDGRFDAAAAAFERLSTPYDAALAMLDAGAAASTRRALDVVDRLGADAVAAKVRADLRAAGAAAVPGPRRATTLGNPAGLTSRQVDVLRLLADGLTNAELADRLFLSVKTVDHHVSAILTKLDVTKRRDAVRRARETGILT